MKLPAARIECIVMVAPPLQLVKTIELCRESGQSFLEDLSAVFISPIQPYVEPAVICHGLCGNLDMIPSGLEIRQRHFVQHGPVSEFETAEGNASGVGWRAELIRSR